MSEIPAAHSGGAILAQFGIGPSDFIDAGGKSDVFALGSAQVLRIFRDPADFHELERLRAFLADVRGRLPFPTPSIETVDPDGRFVVERRLPGRSLLRRLPSLTGDLRRTAIRNFVAAADGIGRLELPDRQYGHILADQPLGGDTWTGFLRLSLDRAIARNASVIAGAAGNVEDLRSRALALLADVPDLPVRALVHGDYFPGNVLVDDALAVSAVVDFSDYTMVGDPLYDALTAPIFLEMIEQATVDDCGMAQATVAARHGDEIRAARFYRAHAAFWMADPAFALPPYPRIYSWAIENLRRLAGDTRQR